MIFHVMVIVGLLLFAGGLAGTAWRSLRPSFGVGDCISINGPRERWQNPVVMRILEVGESGYRAQFRGDKGGWLSGDTSVSFSHQHFYSKVKCPE